MHVTTLANHQTYQEHRYLPNVLRTRGGERPGFGLVDPRRASDRRTIMGADRELHGADSRLQTIHREVIASVEAQLGSLAELVSTARPWFSATFEGVQHELHFGIADPTRLTALEADDGLILTCPDHVIVSVGTEQADDRASIHVLTICCDNSCASASA